MILIKFYVNNCYIFEPIIVIYNAERIFKAKAVTRVITPT